ncbi:MAG: hypothetical protein OES47_04535 [Acidobacteriota bacterium]|nr:hypothetical protein [Acidobacteriota bacterium]
MKKGNSFWRHPVAASACALVLAASVGARAVAQEHGEEHSAEHEEHEFHRHHVSVFLGVTDGEVTIDSGPGPVTVKDEQAFTVGLDYEYRLTRRWGIGALVDYAGKDFRTSVLGVPVFIHASERLKLVLAPGIEEREHEGSEFMVRAGLEYEFEVGGISVAPAVNLDFVDDEETLVYGLSVGKGF